MTHPDVTLGRPVRPAGVVLHGPQLLNLDRAACLALLPTRPIGRLIFTQRALPEALPVNYAADGAGVVIRLWSGSAVVPALRQAVVAFQVDDVDLEQQSGWSVTLIGRAREVTDPVERQRVMALGLRSWAVDDQDVFVIVPAERLTGTRLVAG